MPDWLNGIAIASLWAGAISALIIIIDIVAGHRQHMWIMNVVWPLTALYSGPLGLCAYYKAGRLSTHDAMARASKKGEKPPGQTKPFWQTVGVGATHCGSGCVLGDILAEWFVFFVPFTILGRKMFAAWTVDYLAAFLFGIAFHYLTIVPMRGLSVTQGIKQALKADALSLTAWQVGMYGWMAIVVFAILGHEIPKNSPEFWFMMQIAMWCGFLTSYPVNWLLLRRGIKEQM